MKLFGRTSRVLQDGFAASNIENIIKKHYEYVTVEENFGEYGDRHDYPYRAQIRTHEITAPCLFDLESAGFKTRPGSTCNEWETSINIKHYSKYKEHPPHLPVDFRHIPEELNNLSPNWYEFLTHVKYIGELLGTIDTDYDMEKQAFGECATSIVLETYKRCYGDEYKSHQCHVCIDHELHFKADIVAHNFDMFEKDLQAFVTHFITTHPEEYKKVQENPEDSKKSRY